MMKFATISSILALTLAPVAAFADDSVNLLTSKSTGSLDGAVSDNSVQAVPVTPVAVGGLSTAAAIGLGVVGLIVVGALLNNDDNNNNTTTTTDGGGDDSDG